MLGEKIKATIKAKYYFGAPVTKAKVKYKVMRSSQTERWYPLLPLGLALRPRLLVVRLRLRLVSGLAAIGAACGRFPFWWPRPQQPPELVAEREVEIGADGTVKVEIDTAVAKAIHRDQDHSYTITAEVVDALAADDRRHRQRAGRPQAVQGLRLGRSRLLPRRRHDPRRLHRPHARRQAGRGQGRADAAADHLRSKRQAGGNARADLEARHRRRGPGPAAIDGHRRPGQYRLSYKVTDGKKHTIEGGYLFTIIGEGFDSAQFRFNHLELVPDKADYAPGDKVKLQINTDRAGSTVLLFARPTNGVYLKPTVHPHGRQEHGRGDRGRRRRTCPTSSSRRSPWPTAALHRSPADRRAAGETGAEHRGDPFGGDLPAGPEGQGASQADRLLRASRSSARPWWPSTTSRSSTSPAARTCRRSRSSSGSGGAITSRRPNRTWAGTSATSFRPIATGMSDLGVFGGSVAEDRRSRG